MKLIQSNHSTSSFWHRCLNGQPMPLLHIFSKGWIYQSVLLNHTLSDELGWRDWNAVHCPTPPWSRQGSRMNVLRVIGHGQGYQATNFDIGRDDQFDGWGWQRPQARISMRLMWDMNQRLVKLAFLNVWSLKGGKECPPCPLWDPSCTPLLLCFREHRHRKQQGAISGFQLFEWISHGFLNTNQDSPWDVCRRLWFLSHSKTSSPALRYLTYLPLSLFLHSEHSWVSLQSLLRAGIGCCSMLSVYLRRLFV